MQRLIMHDLRADAILSVRLHMHVQSGFIPQKETPRFFMPFYVCERTRTCEQEVQHRKKPEVISENENLECSEKRNLCPVVSRPYREFILI